MKNKHLAIILLILTIALLESDALASTNPPVGKQAGGLASPSYYLGPVANIGGTDGDELPAVTQDGAGVLHAAFTTRRYGQPVQVAYSSSSDGGATWSAARQISQHTGRSQPNYLAIATNTAGVHVLWSSPPPSGGELALWFATSASGWQPATNPVPPTYFSAIAASLSAPPDGSLRAVYFAGSTLTPYIITGTVDGSSWSQPDALSNIGYGGHGADAYNTGSDTYIAYSDIIGDGTKVRVVAVRGGRVDADIASGSLTGAYNPSIILATSTLYAAFCGWATSGGGAHRDVYISSRAASQPGTWLTPTLFAQLPSGQSCDTTSLALDAGGNPVLLYNVETAGSGYGYSTLYLAALPSGVPQSILSYGGQVRFTSAQLVPESAGLGVVAGYVDYAPSTPIRRALYAPILADGQATPTSPPPSPTPAASPTGGACTNPFVDIGGSPYYYEIVTLYCEGVINGVDSTHFAPTGSATRAQFIKMLMLAFGLTLRTPAGAYFNDVPPNHWAYGYIEGAYADYLVTGYDTAWCNSHPESGGYPCYRPDMAVSRAQLARLIVEATGVQPYTPPQPTFQDVPASSWAYSYIETANYWGLVQGQNGYFSPNQPATRELLAHVLWTAQHLPLDAMPMILRAKGQP